MTSQFKKIPTVLAMKHAFGSSYRDTLYGVTFKDLVKLLGAPSFTPQNYPDGKSYYGWVILWKDKYYHIYDWKTYDEDYTLTECDQWNIGGKRGDALQDLRLATEILIAVKEMKDEVAA